MLFAMVSISSSIRPLSSFRCLSRFSRLPPHDCSVSFFNYRSNSLSPGKSNQSYQETYLLKLAGSNVNHVLFASVPSLTLLQLSSLASSSLVLPVPPVLSARLLSQPSNW